MQAVPGAALALAIEGCLNEQIQLGYWPLSRCAGQISDMLYGNPQGNTAYDFSNFML